MSLGIDFCSVLRKSHLYQDSKNKVLETVRHIADNLCITLTFLLHPIDEVARDLMGHSAASSIVGEVMNLDDFLDEVSEPDPKYSPRRGDHHMENAGYSPRRGDHHVENAGGHPTGGRVFNPLANLG